MKMRLRLAVCGFLASSAPALAEDWWVIVGYVDHLPNQYVDAVLDTGNQLDARLQDCGARAFWDFASKFNGFDTAGRGSVFVVDTPIGLDNPTAARLLAKIQPCVPDAYIKTASYAGE